MCYHYSNKKTPSALELRYKAKLNFDFEPEFHINGFDTSKKHAVITAEEPETIQGFHWGLIPGWVRGADQAKDIRLKTLNAKSETVFELPSFRSAIPHKRCLIPADGFFEWMELKKQKYPHFISNTDDELFSMAGIYESWKDPSTGQILRTYSILTCPANPMMERIHNSKKRMPLILPREFESTWLDPSLKKESIQQLFLSYPEENMKAHTISKLITSSEQNSNVPEVFEKVVYPELENFA